MKKVLCLCEGGNCRSVTLAYMLKVRYGMDALSAGLAFNSAKTIKMLYDWADKVIVLDKKLMPDLEFLESSISPCREKVVLYDVGPDMWFDPNYDLMEKLQAHINRDHVAGMVD